VNRKGQKGTELQTNAEDCQGRGTAIEAAVYVCRYEHSSGSRDAGLESYMKQ